MSKLFMMVGIPGSGKSYYLKNMTGDNCKVVSRDKIRFSIIKTITIYMINLQFQLFPVPRISNTTN